MLRMTHVIGLFDRAEPTWKHVKGLCVAPLLGFDPTSGTIETHPGPARSITIIQQRVTQPFTDGRLQIRWTHPQWDPVGTEYRLASGFSVLPPNTAQDTTLDEHRFQMTGQVDDATQVRSGRLAHPTVMLSVRRTDARPYAIQLSIVRTGQQYTLEVDSLDEIGTLLSKRD